MLAANETVAEHYNKLNLPFIYRIHEQPKEEKMQRFFDFASALGILVRGTKGTITPKDLQHVIEGVEDKPEAAVINTMLLRSMQQARYSEDNFGHYGLAADYYTHFTSPIRRYPDLIVHRLIRSYSQDKSESNQSLWAEELPEIADHSSKMERRAVETEREVDAMKKAEFMMDKVGEEFDQSLWAEELPEIADHSSKMERRAVETEREVDAMKKAEFMMDKVGEEFDGIISSVVKFGLFIELPNTVEGLIHINELKQDYFHFIENHLALVGERTGLTFKIGQKVRVKVVKADPDERAVDFELVSAEEVTALERPKARNGKSGKREGKQAGKRSEKNGKKNKRYSDSKQTFGKKKGKKPFYKGVKKKKKKK